MSPLIHQLDLLQDAGSGADAIGISILSVVVIVVALAMLATIRRRDP